MTTPVDSLLSQLREWERICTSDHRGWDAELLRSAIARIESQGSALTARDAELSEYKQRAELAEISQVEHNKEFGRCADLKKDAARYQWLLEHASPNQWRYLALLTPVSVNETIDDAILAKETTK